jgi:WD40 repeat protein
MSLSKAEAGLCGHTDDVACLAVQSNTSHSLASGSEDSTVRLWDLRAAAQSQCISCISTIFKNEPVVSLAWHPTEEHRLLAAAGCEVCECDLRKLSDAPSAVLAHRYTANEVHQWRLSTELTANMQSSSVLTLRTMHAFALMLQDEVNHLDVHCDGAYFSAADDTGAVRIYDLKTKKSHRNLKNAHTNLCSMALFRPKASGDLASAALDWYVFY